jgi:acyl carrier protein
MQTQLQTNDIKNLMIKTFDLDFELDEVTDDMAIFGQGLELDSIDMLELFLQLEKQFGIRIGEDEVKREAFENIGTLTEWLNTFKKQ